MLEEGGVNLSGGQRQKLTIARAYLKPAEYYLIDEGTSALDAGAKAQVLEVLHEELVGKTVVCVAHDKQTIWNADYIVILDDGKIVAQGIYEQVIDESEYLKDMMEDDK